MPQSTSLASQTVDSERNSQRVAQDRPNTRGTERVRAKRLERPATRRMTDDGRFSIDMAAVPPGFVMEWKRHSIMGMEDKRNQVVIRSYHWEPVPHHMQPHILGHLCKNDDEHIMVDGQGLYMRPKYLNEEANAESRADTDYQLGQQLESLRMSSKDQVGQKHTYVKKSTVAVPQPVE